MLKPISSILNKITQLPSLSIENPIIPNSKELMIIGIYDDSLIYTPLHHFDIDLLIQKYPSIWSGYLEKKILGEMCALVSKGNDKRPIRDKIVEFVKIASLLIYISGFYLFEKKISIEVSEEYLNYVPTRYFKEIGGAWCCPIEVKEFIEFLLKGSLPKLLELPRSDLPKNVRMYFINNQAVDSMLTPFCFLEDKIKRFIIYDKGKAEILGIALKELEEIAVPEKMKPLLNFQDVNGVSTLFTSSYQIAAAYYIYLKLHFKEMVVYESFLSTPLSIKIIRNSFWAPLSVTAAMLDNKILTQEHIVKGSATKVGNTDFIKWILTSNGLKLIKSFFGKAIKNIEFRVRPFNKAEIITDDIYVFELLKEMIDKKVIIIKIVERSIDNLVFEADYFTIMKIYFTIKLIRGATLISEMNPLNHLIGEEALNSICNKTPFGDIHIIKVDKNGTIDIYLFGKNQEAINSLLFAVSEEVKFNIVFQEIEKGILARKLTGSSIYYVFYALDKMSF